MAVLAKLFGILWILFCITLTIICYFYAILFLFVFKSILSFSKSRSNFLIVDFRHKSPIYNLNISSTLDID